MTVCGAQRSPLAGVAERLSRQALMEPIAEAAECKVHLFLFVKVREGWENDPERYREMGLPFPKE